MIHVKEYGHIAVLNMDHGKVNAMSIEFCDALRKQLFEIANSNYRAVVITSATSVFSAGVDLVRLIEEPPEYIDAFVPSLSALLVTPMMISIPVIAAVNGAAVAGGCVLSCSCDYRIIDSDASIGMPEMRLGVPLPTVPVEIIRSVVSPNIYKSLIHLGSTYQGSEAVKVGLADEDCSSEHQSERALEIAAQLSRIPPATFSLSKRQIRKPVIDAIKLGQSEFDKEVIVQWKSSDVRNMIEEYVADRLNK